ncbi:hypothetical protein BN938_0973 [Mucinivorans hirudinis]|uniref:Large ribosomal subunit protein uL29 n=1 Tax=Mucinivorans hirudinis TaxID=1433126 RepID=A0A060R7C5_9BACT|nr:hypothetical protein BN938_0973 [Mucinivorans hirudinis]
MKTSEIRELSVSEITERIEVAKAEMLTEKLNHSVSATEDSSKLRKSRRDIARMLTILAEKQQ